MAILFIPFFWLENELCRKDARSVFKYLKGREQGNVYFQRVKLSQMSGSCTLAQHGGCQNSETNSLQRESSSVWGMLGIICQAFCRKTPELGKGLYQKHKICGQMLLKKSSHVSLLWFRWGWVKCPWGFDLMSPQLSWLLELSVTLCVYVHTGVGELWLVNNLLSYPKTTHLVFLTGYKIWFWRSTKFGNHWCCPRHQLPSPVFFLPCGLA